MDSSEMRFRSNSSSEITVLKYIIDCKRVKTKLFSASCQTNEHKENYCSGIYGPGPCTVAISFSRVPPHLLYVTDISMSSAFYSDVASTCLCQSPWSVLASSSRLDCIFPSHNTIRIFEAFILLLCVFTLWRIKEEFDSFSGTIYMEKSIYLKDNTVTTGGGLKESVPSLLLKISSKIHNHLT